MLEKLERFRENMRAGQTMIGPILDFDGWELMKALRQAPIHFVWLDLEHGSLTMEGAAKAIDSLTATPLLPIIRAKSVQVDELGKMMDLGPGGILFPHCDSAAIARQALQSCLYPPKGTRSTGPNFAANQWMLEGGDYIRESNRNALFCFQIEHVDALAEIDEICAIERVDLIFTARFDLSASLGCPGDFDNPLLKDAEARILSAARRNGKFTGTIATKPDSFAKTLTMDYDFVVMTSLMNFMKFGVDAFLG
jgi:2-keto-3-deoxy-L-rhamnonate aldolase RhmA